MLPSRSFSHFSQPRRLPPPRPGRVDVAAWIDRNVALETRARVSVAGGPALVVPGDADQLDQMLINLLKNAVDSLGQERRITISTYTVQASEQQRSGVNIEISDTGAGISPDLLPKVFDFFMTTKNPANGTGLGLAVCQEIVKEHGGKIAINSQVGKGTTVRIFFPTDPANGRSLTNG